MLRIVPHTVPRVGRSYEHFPDGFELHLLRRVQGTSLTRNRTPPRTAKGPYAYAYCMVLGGGVFLWARYPCRSLGRVNRPILWVASTVGRTGLPRLQETAPP